MDKETLTENSELFTPGCVLNAFGAGFEPDSFLIDTLFNPETIIAYGTLGLGRFEYIESGNNKSRKKQSFPYLHLLLKVSYANDSPTQIQDAINFLKQYKKEILRLSNFPKVEGILLSFSLEKGIIHAKHPTELLDLASVTGITGIC